MTQSPGGAVPDRPSAHVPRVPSSTYRLQLNDEFTLGDAVRWVSYLHRLGVGWVYVSPLLQAEPGSTHGYDVIDHSHTDAARGGRDGLAALAGAAHAQGIGVLVDIVPNHVGVASPLLSVWWRDVLTRGRASHHAAAFDIDWEAGDGRIVLPVLGDGPDELASLHVERDGDGDGVLRYYEHAFPLAPGSAPPGDSPIQVHERQHYRLVNFRRADTELNYRRFFAVTSLAGIRVEDPAVFDASHAEIGHWLEHGWVDGLRVDHPDGLADPGGYLEALATLSGDRYTVVEKILEPFEELPRDWRCDGTTGYDALALIDRVLIDPAGALGARSEQSGTASDAGAGVGRRDGVLGPGGGARSEQFGTASDAGAGVGRRDGVAGPGGGARSEQFDTAWAELTHVTKRAVADGILSSEVRRLARLLPGAETVRPGDATWQRRLDALAELLACFAVYRTYEPAADPELTDALDRARARRPELADELGVIGEAARDASGEFAVRLQQTSGSVMAKGVEDCAFYRFPGLVSLAEVGNKPSIGALSPDGFHVAFQRRLRTWPHSMTTLSTHDTKRGEDVRARIGVLAEVSDEWMTAVADWTRRLDFPDPVFANLLFQTAVGAWPVERERLHAYAEKAAREAGAHTGWIDPDADFEESVHALVDACYPGGAVHAELSALAERIRPAGWSNALAAKLIQLTAPGVPDVYRGTELWRNDLVDPDNRRPFDALAPDGPADLLARLDDGWLPPVDAGGAAKLLVTSWALRARRDRSDLFTGYRGLLATGSAAEHLLAFDRGGALTVATRLPLGLARRGGWADTRLTLPGAAFRDALTGRVFSGQASADGIGDGGFTVEAGELLARYPVALLLAA